MSIYCKKCKEKIKPHFSGGLSDKLHADLILAITKLTWKDFKNATASGGTRYQAKIKGKYFADYFVDSGNNARIMIDGTGRWLASIDFEGETHEDMLYKLQAVLKEFNPTE